MATTVALCLSFHPVKPAERQTFWQTSKCVVCQNVCLFTGYTERKVR